MTVNMRFGLTWRIDTLKEGANFMVTKGPTHFVQGRLVFFTFFFGLFSFRIIKVDFKIC